MRKIIYLLFLVAGAGVWGCKPVEGELITKLHTEIVAEVQNGVLPFWRNYAPSPDGGFYGTIQRDGTPDVTASRGGVLNARILWSFAAAYRSWGNKTYLELANRAQRYFLDTFIDSVNGGVYWLVNSDGEVLNGSKYTYAITYGIYALVEHYLATGNEESLQTAIRLYKTLEENARDPQHDGYIESFTIDWKPEGKYDNNAPKTTNAHIHVLEAYMTLYSCWKDEGLKEHLTDCIDLFLNRIYDSTRKHFNHFFDNEWNSVVEVDSYGHDVETGWLLCKAARILGDKRRIEAADKLAVEVTDASWTEGMSEQGSLCYEKRGDRMSRRASWWGQVEMILACINAWQITGSEIYLQKADSVWSFIKVNMIDTEYGEWFSDCYNGKPMIQGTKASMWRCPYHTVRLGVEIDERLK